MMTISSLLFILGSTSAGQRNRPDHVPLLVQIRAREGRPCGRIGSASASLTARLAMGMRVWNRHFERVFDPSRKDNLLSALQADAGSTTKQAGIAVARIGRSTCFGRI
jgi:hypothetical protein